MMKEQRAVSYCKEASVPQIACWIWVTSSGVQRSTERENTEVLHSDGSSVTPIELEKIGLQWAEISIKY
jgi:hypothetical protein